TDLASHRGFAGATADSPEPAPRYAAGPRLRAMSRLRRPRWRILRSEGVPKCVRRPGPRSGAPGRFSRGLSDPARLPLLHLEGDEGALAERGRRDTGGDLEDVALAGGELALQCHRAKVELHLLPRLHVVEGDEQHLVLAAQDPEAKELDLLGHLHA